MNPKFFIFFLFIISRIFFINSSPVFFDSPEYLIRFANSNYLEAIISGHIPLHEGFIILFWPIYQTISHLKMDPAFTIILLQIFFSSLAIICFYNLIEIIKNKRVALISTIILSLTPLYWIINVSIMTESTYINLFIISLYLIALYLKSNSHLRLYILGGCISLGLAFLTNPTVALWMPLLFFMIYYMEKRKFPRIASLIILTISLAVLINSFFISKTLHIPFYNGLLQYLSGSGINPIPEISSYVSILRAVRNAFIPILQNNTAIIITLSIISFIYIFKKDKKMFTIALLWIFPTIITNQWYSPLLSGRHGTISAFGLAFLAALFLEKRKALFLVTVVYLLFTSLPTLFLLRQPIPYLEEQKFVRTLPEGLLIDSHFARPQIQGQYSGKTLFINEPGWSKEELINTIDNYLLVNKPIFITSQALSDPYGLYSGPYLYPLSLSYAKDPEIKSILSFYSFRKYNKKEIGDNIKFFIITNKGKSKYPDIQKLNLDKRQIGYYDPVTQLWLFIERARIIQSQSITQG